MQLWVLSGGDDEAMCSRWSTLLESALAGGDDREDVDCAVDDGAALIAAVCSPAMFGPRRVVAAENFSSVTDAVIALLVRVAADSDAAVIARTPGTFPSAMKKGARRSRRHDRVRCA